ncbi:MULTISPECIES: Na+/H+ antiporter subunit E [Halomonadaceae]|jgi:multicomponent K+:H+ antiporter subunit E|uniref:Na+/H+ antiporter subunit E n=1 Tax=Billgrantia aerodenitrificans TaxID=2733483 RepID=A0ABS9AMN9_9GAMM|nr:MULTISPECIES: Na+/H+ antiporter subunit E [Halomonas]MCE8023075.1 Na+/H+ antiporter subunit E [Halomonas aerodenitrificans]MCE8037807.1 Na+/H+ antiporter subunit E [Halomonas sp. MCCC 1A11062]
MKAMGRFLPTPTLSLVLLVVWLLMVRSIAPGQLLLGTVLAVGIPLLTQGFWEPLPRVKHPLKLVWFVLVVMWDIVKANVHVSLLILLPRREPHPGFVEYPLEVKDRLAITLLANTITMTPGTVSTNIRLDGSSLLIHVLDLDDEQALIREIRDRYERPLKEIFEC